MTLIFLNFLYGNGLISSHSWVATHTPNNYFAPFGRTGGVADVPSMVLEGVQSCGGSAGLGGAEPRCLQVPCWRVSAVTPRRVNGPATRPLAENRC